MNRSWKMCVLLLSLLAASSVGWAEDDARRAESLVRKVYFEGLPRDDAREIGAHGSARLVELLEDPDEIRFHPNITLALALSGQPDAYAALERYAAPGPSGEIDRSQFQALLSVSIAMGYLADRDVRAFHWLTRACSRDRSAPARSFRRFRAAKAHRLIRERAITALAHSSRPEASRFLGALVEEESTLGGSLLDVARAARSFQARVRTEGLDAVQRSYQEEPTQ